LSWVIYGNGQEATIFWLDYENEILKFHKKKHVCNVLGFVVDKELVDVIQWLSMTKEVWRSERMKSFCDSITITDTGGNTKIQNGGWKQNGGVFFFL
jgi:hypothetical protein